MFKLIAALSQLHVLYLKGKDKMVKFALGQAKTSQRGSRGIALLFL
jgi:hypothetical protein